MRFAVSRSNDYTDSEQIVIRDFQSTPRGRVWAIIPRDNLYEAEQIAQQICDCLNKHEPSTST